jgi:DNA repair protein RadA/Sms
MLGNGLREVSNPSEILISHKNENYLEQQLHLLEGMRPLMINSSTRKHCSVRNSTTQYHGLQKAQYDSGRIRKKSWF